MAEMVQLMGVLRDRFSAEANDAILSGLVDLYNLVQSLTE